MGRLALHITEMPLVQIIGSAVERAYWRGDLLDQRRHWCKWSDFRGSRSAKVRHNGCASCRAHHGSADSTMAKYSLPTFISQAIVNPVRPRRRGLLGGR